MKINFGCTGIIIGLIVLSIICIASCKEGFAHSKKITFSLTKSTSNKIFGKDSITKIKYDTTIEILPYGIFDQTKLKNDSVEYELVPGNVILSIILCETIIVPIQYGGYYLFEPVGLINKNQGIIKGGK